MVKKAVHNAIYNFKTGDIVYKKKDFNAIKKSKNEI